MAEYCKIIHIKLLCKWSPKLWLLHHIKCVCQHGLTYKVAERGTVNNLTLCFSSLKNSFELDVSSIGFSPVQSALTDNNFIQIQPRC